MKTKTRADPVTTDRRRLGEAIRGLREERGITLQEVADHVGQSVATLSRIERGGLVITYDVLAAISRALGITPAGLVWRGQPKPKKLSPEMDRIYLVFDELSCKLESGEMWSARGKPMITRDVLTVAEIESQFESEWVLVESPQTNEALEVQSGTVRCHSKDRDEVYRKAVQLRPKRFAVLYTGTMPKDTAIVL